MGSSGSSTPACSSSPSCSGRASSQTYLLNNAHGQPAVVSWVITNIGHFIGPHIAVWNTFFALIQVAIGLGLLFRPTVRPALALSFGWALGVWVLRRGPRLRPHRNGQRTHGRPGLGVHVRPDRPDGVADADATPSDSAVGVASSAAARGVGGAATPLIVWSGYWSLAAVLFLLPQNRTSTSISSAITGMSVGRAERGTTTSCNSVGSTLSSTGTRVGLGAGHRCRWSSASARSSAVGPVSSWPRVRCSRWPFGLTGQGSGRHLHRIGHRPQHRPDHRGVGPGHDAGPGRGPVRGPDAAGRVAAPPRRARPVSHSARSPWRCSSAPTTRPRRGSRSGTAMSGMTGMAGSGSTGGTSPSTASCTGTSHSGLVVTNSPLMSMGGPGANMNMNGADASAAAGLNSTKENWHYTGPAFPAAFAQLLLANGGNNANQIHMARVGLRRRTNVLRPDQRRPVRAWRRPGPSRPTPTRRQRKRPVTSPCRRRTTRSSTT